MTISQSQSGRRRGGRDTDETSPSAAAGMSAAESAALDLRELEAALLPALEEVPRTPQQARSREKRDELLRAAEALFVERGYAGVTADDIAAAAGVSVGTFYNYYRNKRQILLTLTLQRLGDIFTHLRLARMDLAHGNHHEVIRGAIRSVIAGGRRQGLRNVWQQVMSLEPELAPYQAAIRRYAVAQLERQLRAARESGATWPDLDIEATALAIFAMLDALSGRRESDLPDERVIESVTTLIERALFPPEERSRT